MVRGEVCGEWSKLEEEEEEEERRGKGKLGGTKKGKAGGRKGNNNYKYVKIANLFPHHYPNITQKGLNVCAASSW